MLNSQTYPPIQTLGKPFSPGNIAGLVSDLSASGLRTPTGTDYSAVFSSSSLSVTNSSLYLSPTNGLTICCWFYPTATFSTSINTDSGNGGYRFSTVNNGFFSVLNSSGTSIGDLQNISGPAITLSQWAFFAFQVDPVNTQIKGKRDRYPWITTPITGTLAAGTAAFTLGTGHYGGYAGNLAGLAIAQQVLLDSEVNLLYGAPGSVTYSSLPATLQAKLVEFWSFTETSGSRVGSKSGITLAASGTVSRSTGPACARRPQRARLSRTGCRAPGSRSTSFRTEHRSRPTWRRPTAFSGVRWFASPMEPTH